MINVWIKITAIALLLLLLAGAFYWWQKFRLPAVLAKRIQQEINERSDSLYRFYSGSISVNLWPLRVSIVGAGIKPDVQHPDFTQKHVFQVHMKKLIIRGLNYRKLFRKKKAVLKAIRVHAPDIRMHINPREAEPNQADRSGSSAQKAAIRSLSVGHFAVDSASFTLYDKQQQQALVDYAAGELQDFTYDLQHRKTTLGQSSGKLRGLSMLLKDRLDSLKIAEVGFNTADSTLQVRKILMKPLYKRIRYSEEYGYRKTRNELNIPGIALEKVDFPKLLRGEGVFAETAMIDSLRLFAFKDKRKPIAPGTYKALPAELVKRARLPFGLTHVHLKNGYVKYQEIGAETVSDGTVFFSNIEAHLRHFTNDSMLLNGAAPLQLRASAYLQGKSPVSLLCSRPESGEADVQVVSGSLSDVHLPEMNKILQSAAHMKVESGKVEKLDFRFRANPRKASGTMTMHYSGLKVAFLNELHYKGFEKRRFLSFVANRAIRRNNPSCLGKELKGTIYAERDTRKSVFAYWWQSVFSGIKTIILHRPVQRFIDKK